MKHRIAIVDDSPVIRHSLRSGIDQSLDWEVCGQAENGKRGGGERVEEFHPEIVIPDLKMPIMNWLEAARRIHRGSPHTSMLVADVVSKSDRLADHLATALRQLVA